MLLHSNGVKQSIVITSTDKNVVCNNSLLENQNTDFQKQQQEVNYNYNNSNNTSHGNVVDNQAIAVDDASV